MAVRLHSKHEDNKNKGLKIERVYTSKENNLLEKIEYETRCSKIVDTSGKTVFEMENVEVPKSWSQVATDVLAQKYLRKKGLPKNIAERNEFTKEDSHEKIKSDKGVKAETSNEWSIKQVSHRLAGTWTWWGEQFQYFASEEDANAFYGELKYIIIAQIAAPNSPQWFNTGLNWAYGITGPAQGHFYVDPATGVLTRSQDAYSHPAPHACFIQGIEDDLVNQGGIFDLLLREARVFKYGAGTGTNFSKLRESGAPLSGGGTSSGVMSFLSVFDKATASVKSGGTTRRAAKMVILDIDHPDIEQFIKWKVKEEKKVVSLIAGSHLTGQFLKEIMICAETNGLDIDKNLELPQKIKSALEANVPINYIKRVLMLVENGINSKDFEFSVFDSDYRSEAYTTVDGQNSNNVVRVTNDFMQALQNKSDWKLISRVEGSVKKTEKAINLWNEIAQAAWESADPGLQFDTTINDWHTCPRDGRINASNPCSEYMFLDETACNLASINLEKFYDSDKREFDVATFKHVVRLWTIVLEISVLMAQLISEKMAELTNIYRTLGLGFANLGTLLMKMGLPYDSDEARNVSATLTAIMTGNAYKTSAEMAKELGSFDRYENNKDDMLRVIYNHKCATYNAENDYINLTIKPCGIDQSMKNTYLLKEAQKAWDEAYNLGKEYGYRNAQVSVVAPTGTIGLVMDCDTTGIEPDFALVKYKKLVGGGYFKIVNQSINQALQALGYNDEQIAEILEYIIGTGSIKNSPYINEKTLKEKGFTDDKIALLEKNLKSAFDISFVFNKYVLGDDFVEVILNGSNETNLLKALNFTNSEILDANRHICGHMTTEGAPHLKPEHYSVFDCAAKCGEFGTRYIAPIGHVKMLAAVQPFITGSISKTVNMPEHATIEEIKDIYWKSWELGLKCITIYRDSSKLSQPLSTHADEDLKYARLFDITKTDQEKSSKTNPQNAQNTQQVFTRQKLPLERISITHKFEIGDHEGYITVGLFKNGQPGEIFLRMSKEGSTFSGIMDAWAISLSLNLQYGVPLKVLLDKYSHYRFEPSGATNNKNIPIAKSIVDYVARWLALKFLDKETAKRYHNSELVDRAFENGDIKAKRVAEIYMSNSHKVDDSTYVVNASEIKPLQETGIDLGKRQAQVALRQNNEDASICPECGAVMIRNGACYKCLDCGATSGCS